MTTRAETAGFMVCQTKIILDGSFAKSKIRSYPYLTPLKKGGGKPRQIQDLNVAK